MVRGSSLRPEVWWLGVGDNLPPLTPQPLAAPQEARRRLLLVIRWFI